MSANTSQFAPTGVSGIVYGIALAVVATLALAGRLIARRGARFEA